MSIVFRHCFCSFAFTLLVINPCPALAAGKLKEMKATAATPIKRQGVVTFQNRIFTGKVSPDARAGEKLLLDGKYKEASDAFWKALNKNSKDVSALCGLGFTQAIQFKVDAASQQFDKALKVDPNYPIAHVGKAYVTLNRLQSSNMTILRQKASLLANAEAECQRALRAVPGLPEALVVLGMVQKEQGRLNDSMNSFSKAIEGDPKFGAAYAQRGLVQLMQNNWAGAESDFKQAIAIRSSNSTAHFGLGRAYLGQGKVDAALKELNTAAYLNTNSAPVQIALGDAWRIQGNTNAAVSAYQKAIAIKSENEMAYLNLSQIREDRGDLELAMAELRSGIELNPANVPLHLRVGDIALKLEKSDVAIDEYTKALRLDPDSTPAVKGMTRAYVQKAQKEANGAFFVSNNYEAAEGMIQQAIRLNPNDMELRLADAKFRAMSGKTVDLSTLGTPTSDPQRIAYAEALTAQYRFDEAAQQMAIVLNNTNDPKQLLAVADISLMNRDLDSAQAAYQKATTIPESSARARRGLDQVASARDTAQKEYNFAKDLAMRKQLASGIDKFRNAAYLNPRMADAHLGLAEALKKFFPKRPAPLREAAQHYRAYVSLSPNLPEKEKEKYLKQAEKLVEKAYKIEQKQQVND